MFSFTNLSLKHLRCRVLNTRILVPHLLLCAAIIVDLPGKVVQLRSGFSHAVAILEDGDVYVWGKMQSAEIKSDGRLPVYHDQLYPRKVDTGGGRAVEAFCSSFTTVLRMEDGR